MKTKEQEPRVHAASRIDSILTDAYRLNIRYGSNAISLGGAVLLTNFTNQAADFGDISSALVGMFDPAHPVSFLNYIAVLLIAIPLLSRPLLKRWRKNRSYDAMMAHMLSSLKDRSLWRYNRIAVNRSITLQKCPEIELGWAPSQLIIDHRATLFALPAQIEEPYHEFLETEFTPRLGADGKTVMLREVPIAWTDVPTMVLKTEENLYSFSQFYWHHVAHNARWHEDTLFQVLDAENSAVPFAHNLCLHLVVLTNDDKALLTKRSTRVASDQGTWSCSIEENLKPTDLHGERSGAVLRWMKRAILEELALNDTYYDESNLKILSIFLESEKPNISVAGLVTLNIDAQELRTLLRTLPRNDYEFTTDDYLSIKELARELTNPSRYYHPTSGYRILMALLHRYGEANFSRKFIELWTAGDA